MSTPRQEIVACLFAHEMLRRLGIVSADIFIDLRLAGYFGIAVVTADKRWSWLLGALPVPSEEFLVEWNTAVAWWNGASHEELDVLGIEQSPQMAQAGEIIRSLLAKGIPLDPMADVRAQDARKKAAN